MTRLPASDSPAGGFTVPQIPLAARYRRYPRLDVTDLAESCHTGWNAIGGALRAAMEGHSVLAVDTYPGADHHQLLRHLEEEVRPEAVVGTSEAMLAPAEIDGLVEPDLTDDPVFGRLTTLRLEDFFDPTEIGSLRRSLSSVAGPALVYGPGAALVCDPDVLVYADLARHEIVQRFRRDEISNLGTENRDERWSLQYKRAWFVDWRVADRHKEHVYGRADLFLDSHRPEEPKLASGGAIRAGLSRAATQPWSPVPFFDPAPWGGQWMKEVCALDRDSVNYGWCFNCVPEENSILLDFGTTTVELPSLDVVLFHPDELLGEGIVSIFGAEFPIRFDFLDTMGGGNLSFQVHPLTAYIQDTFGMHYTQDESYYLVDAAPDSTVYLGLREGVDADEMLSALESAQVGGEPFEVDHFANRWPARRHDHFLIPAGTVHCSGANSMVLEISATPYLFTFKLWDWGRLGLDGRPRPIHIGHGREVIQWDRTTAWVRENLINRIQTIAEGDGWREERTGLHDLEFIETRRHWFDRSVSHDTRGTVNVVCLVEGAQAVIRSPSGAFQPFLLNYAEVAVVPACIGPYTITPHGPSAGETCVTIKAFVRGAERSA